MFNTRKQFHIERFLSHGKPYLASHPELGVPLGIFNTVDEPNYAARVKSIKKLGPKGNQISLYLAKQEGIKNPLPSYADVILKDSDNKDVKVTQASFDKAVEDYMRRTGTDSSSTRGRGYSGDNEMAKMLRELSKARSQADLTMNESMDMLSKMTDVINGGKLEAADKMGVYMDIISLTDGMRKDIINVMGMDEAFMSDIITTVTDASSEFTGWALTANDAMKMLKETALATGRAFILPKESLINATKLEEIYDMDMANMIAEFDKIGKGSKEAIESTKDAIATAGRYGAVIAKFLPTVEANMDKINTYGFSNGVNGLHSMVAEAQVLGYNFENALAAADKAFTPEGAIEMAAQLQMIGGAASELLDPFQLMYMAQNDVEALQASIIKTAESAVMFNKETGEFGISPGERMRLKSLAEATGQDYTNLAETAVRAAKKTQAIGKLGGIPELNEQDKKLIASMADINPDGTFSVTLGKDELSFDQLGDAIQKDKGALLEQLRKQSNKDSLNLEEVNKAQLSVQEGMAANTAIIQNILTQAAAGGLLGTTAQDFASELANSGLGAFLTGEGMGTFMPSGTTTPPGITDLMGTFGQGIPDLFNSVALSGSPLTPAINKAFTGSKKGESDPYASQGGGLFPGPEMIEDYLKNTPEGQTLINQYMNSPPTPPVVGGNATNITFGPLEIKYDGNTLRLTPSQVREVLPPLFDEIALGVSKSNKNSTTP